MLYGVAEEPEFSPRKLASVCGSRLLVTVHREPLVTVRVVRDRCRRNPAHVIGRGVDFVLYAIIDGMVDRYALVVDAYEAQIEDLEEASLDAEVDESILARVGELRHKLLEFRRVAASQRELIAPLASGQYEYISDGLERRFSHVEDHATQVVEIIDGLREQLHGIRENYHTVLATRLNSVMKTLTVFAAVAMTLSLVAGIYGMNLRLWPSNQHPYGFGAVLGAMVAVAGALLYVFRRRRWL